MQEEKDTEEYKEIQQQEEENWTEEMLIGYEKLAEKDNHYQENLQSEPEISSSWIYQRRETDEVSMGIRLRQIREKLRFNQQEFARILEISAHTLSKMERGLIVSEETYRRSFYNLSKVLGISFIWLKKGRPPIVERRLYPLTEQDLLIWITQAVVEYLMEMNIYPTPRKVYRVSELLVKRIKPLWIASLEEGEEISEKELKLIFQETLELYYFVEGED